jgi:hypothetical protein
MRLIAPNPATALKTVPTGQMGAMEMVTAADVDVAAAETVGGVGAPLATMVSQRFPMMMS